MANSKISITIKNLPEIKRAFGLAPALMVKELNKGIGETTIMIQGLEKLHYKALGIRVITHGLIDSITRGRYQRNLYGEVGPNVTGSPGVNYALYVHSGTRFMTGRPFLENAVNDSEQEVDKIFTKAVDNVLSDIGKMV